MHIVTDSGCDLNLTAEQREELGIHIVPLSITLGKSSFQEGSELDVESFYTQLETGGELPTTSQPNPEDFAGVYTKLAKEDPSILSIHISSGLSGTINSARAAAAEVPEAKVTFFDTKTLSVGAGWVVEAAARAAHAGWAMERIVALLERIRASTETLYTLKELKYLIHGGRISHLKGLLASMLDIKPIIGVDKKSGMYVQYGQARTISGAIKSLAEIMETRLPPGGPYRGQIVYVVDPHSGEVLQQAVGEKLPCYWLPPSRLSLVLGAHTGPTLIGAVLAPRAVFEGVS
jgi:DegV family protein with EDD domain